MRARAVAHEPGGPRARRRVRRRGTPIHGPPHRRYSVAACRGAWAWRAWTQQACRTSPHSAGPALSWASHQPCSWTPPPQPHTTRCSAEVRAEAEAALWQLLSGPGSDVARELEARVHEAACAVAEDEASSAAAASAAARAERRKRRREEAACGQQHTGGGGE